MIMTKSEPLCTALYFYSMSEELPSTVRYCLKFNDPIDGEILKRATEQTFKRYPYLKKSFVQDKYGRYLIDNPRPVPVIENPGKIYLNSEETNYHLVAISYYGQFLYFNNSHAILDGRGRVPVLKTLLYYYCTERYNEKITMPDLNLADSPVDPAEYADPLMNEVDTSSSVHISSGAIKGEPMNLMSMGLVHSEGKMKKRILKFDEKYFMHVCKHSDATPNTGICVLLCRAIRSIHPDSPKVPVASVAVDLKNTFGTPKTCYPAAWVSCMEFNKEMESLPFDEQCTIFRGKLILDTDPSNMACLAAGFRDFCKAVVPQKDLESKCNFLSNALSQAAPYTFAVSYAGKNDFGECGAHIRGIASEVFVLSPMTLEVTVAGGNFFVTFSQLFEEDIYFNAFLKELESLGVEYRIVDESYIEGPGIKIQEI